MSLHSSRRAYWQVVEAIHQLRERLNGQGGKPIALVIVVPESVIPEGSTESVEFAKANHCVLNCEKMDRTSVLEYMACLLGLPGGQGLPDALTEYTIALADGSPHYVQEILVELQNGNAIQVTDDPHGSKRVEVVLPDGKSERQALEDVEIANWIHTSMVGQCMSLLESLDPDEAAVVKMSAVFLGPFSVPDLAASSSSLWGGALRVDLLRLFKACLQLRKKDILADATVDELDASSHEIGSKGTAHLESMAEFPHFKLHSLLLRKMAQSMTLEQQRLAIKRQALVNRVINQGLPARMENVRKNRANQHIPYYYLHMEDATAAR